ncbi:MAG: hypothetical protein ACRBBN_15120 [Methyloligellaceae bacterium]
MQPNPHNQHYHHNPDFPPGQHPAQHLAQPHTQPYRQPSFNIEKSHINLTTVVVILFAAAALIWSFSSTMHTLGGSIIDLRNSVQQLQTQLSRTTNNALTKRDLADFCFSLERNNKGVQCPYTPRNNLTFSKTTQ